MVGRPKAELVVSQEDWSTLTRWTARRTTAQALALRSRIILRCATGVASTVVAQELGVADQTVCKWRSIRQEGHCGPAGRTSPWCTAQNHRRSGGGGGCQDAGVDAA